MNWKKLLLALFLAGHAGMAVRFGSVNAIAADAVQLKTGAGQAMEATLYKPAGAGPFPAVLILHTSSGLRPPDHAYASKLADEATFAWCPIFSRHSQRMRRASMPILLPP